MAEINMDDLKPNSHQYNKAREEAEKEPKPELSGNVTTRKRSLGRRFIDIFLKDGASPKEIKTYLIEEVIVPAVLENIADAVTTAVEMRFFGSAKRRSRGSGSNTNSRVNYGGYFNGGGGRREQIARSTRESSGRPPLDDYIFESRSDAEMVLVDMRELLDQYQQVTVADYYDILSSYGIRVQSEHTDNKFGWTNLSDVEPVRARGGGYYLDLPRERAL